MYNVLHTPRQNQVYNRDPPNVGILGQAAMYATCVKSITHIFTWLFTPFEGGPRYLCATTLTLLTTAKQRIAR